MSSPSMQRRRRRRRATTMMATISFVVGCLGLIKSYSQAQIYIPQVPQYPGSSSKGGIHLGHNDNEDDDDELEAPAQPKRVSQTWRELDSTEASDDKSIGNKSSLGSLLVAGGGGTKKSHIIRWPNGQFIQTCDDLSGGKCDDENATCQVGGCVCKQGFYLNRQGAACQSIEDLLKNCENDLQCQAFNVDLICDHKSADSSACDCPEDLYFEQETITCLSCAAHLRLLAEPERGSNSSAQLVNGTSTTNGTRTNRCEQHLEGLNRKRPQDQQSGDHPSFAVRMLRKLGRVEKLPASRQLAEKTQVGSNSSIDTTPLLHPSSASSSDPFKIRTPLEVFMGAIILFTVLIVIWFFLRRMFHDCRTILRSLRNPSASELGATALGSEHHYGARSAIHHHHFFDPNRQAAVSRLLATTDPAANPFASHLYQRELAGVMVQHLAANLSPSSTSYALVGLNGTTATRTASATGSALSPTSLDEAGFYQPLSSQQQRAAAAAAQLLLSPSHPALAILRAAAAAAVAQAPNSPDYQVQANLLSSMFDPPPKYEEAIATAQDNQQLQSSSSTTPPPPIDADANQTLETQEYPGAEESLPNSTTRSSLIGSGAIEDNQLRIYIPPGEHLPYSEDLVATTLPDEQIERQQQQQSQAEAYSSSSPDHTTGTTRHQSSRRFSRRFRRSRG